MNRGRPRNSRREELVRLAHLLEEDPGISNLAIADRLTISRNRVPGLRRDLEAMGFAPDAIEARRQERAMRKEGNAARVVAIWRQEPDLASTVREIRANHPGLPASESYIRKILRDAGLIISTQEFNLIRPKPLKRRVPAFWKYSEKYRTDQVIKKGYNEIRKDFGDPKIPWEERPQCPREKIGKKSAKRK